MLAIKILYADGSVLIIKENFRHKGIELDDQVVRELLLDRTNIFARACALPVARRQRCEGQPFGAFLRDAPIVRVKVCLEARKRAAYMFAQCLSGS